jgi:hypothetical protein
MAAPRRLPPTQELKKLVDLGFTHAEIADYVLRTTGERVARSAVSAALSRAGLTTRDGVRYRDELPWRVKADHLTQYPARMLRLLGRRRGGIELTDEEAERLEAWLDGLEEKELVIAYCPDGGGFLYVDADEVGDGSDGVPIRKRLIHADELL